jgi:hypothetical protein
VTKYPAKRSGIAGYPVCFGPSPSFGPRVGRGREGLSRMGGSWRAELPPE